jgi:hypothetical protein
MMESLQGERMLRILALLIFCMVSLLAQGAPVQAHADHASQTASQSGASHAELRASNEGDCPSHAGRCCKSICALCYLPMPPQHQGSMAIRLESSLLLPSRDDLARLILLGRDPPVPRPRDL